MKDLFSVFFRKILTPLKSESLHQGIEEVSNVNNIDSKFTV